MALKKTFELQGDIFIHTDAGQIKRGSEIVSFPAYIKILSITGDKSELSVTLRFSDEKFSFEKHYLIPVSVGENSNNFIAQAYEHLKTLPEFSNALDC